MKKIKVIIADDQLLVCEGIRIILESQPDIEVAATAENGLTVLEYISSMRPDVVLMDIQMPVMSGLDALKEIKAKYPKTIVLMLSTFDPDEYILEAFRNGADGYLLKDISGDKLADAIRFAHAGNVTIPASIAARIIAQIPKETQKKTLADYKLTVREKEIAELIVKGYSNHKISEELEISTGTVKNYISTIYSKLETNSRRETIYLIAGLLKNESDRLFSI